MEKPAFLPIILTLILLAGCIQNPPGTTTTTITGQDITSTTISSTPDKYTGFMKLQVGQWIEYSLQGGLKEKMYYIGEDSVGGETAKGLEVQLTNSSGIMGVFQLWVEPDSGKLIKYVGWINGKIMCIDGSKVAKQFSDLPSLGKTPDKYLPEAAVGFRNISLLSGDRIFCAEFKFNQTTVLASSSVPFGIIQASNENGTLMEMAGYGNGMQRTITKKQVEDCTTI